MIKLILDLINNLSVSTLSKAKTAVSKIFTKVYGHKILVTTTESNFPFDAELKPNYVNGPLAEPVLVDESGVRGVGHAPRIYSLNPYTCRIPEGIVCTAAEQDAFTINMRNGKEVNANYDGVIEDESTEYDGDEDYDGDYWPDPLIGYYTFVANINFFVSADDNHMPIKRILIDWGDGSPVFKVEGMFRNSKPYCASQDEFNYAEEGFGRCKNTYITCTSDADCAFMGNESNTCAMDGNDFYWDTSNEDGDGGYDNIGERRFGDAPRACTPGYKEYFKSLSCDSASADFDIESDSLPGIGLLTAEMKEQIYSLNPDATEVCVFKPKVQVLDNWGWCNSLNGEGLWNDDNLELCNEMSDNFAYTEYQGNIIIVPGNE